MLNVPQIEKAQPETPALIGCRQSQQPVSDQRTLTIQLRLVPIAALTNTVHDAGEANSDAMLGDTSTGHLTARGWP